MWTEKFRPSKFDEVIGFPSSLNELINKTDELPHLLLYGPAGTGKTTTARIIVKQFSGTYLELNASDERGIDTIREKVKDYASIYSEGKRFILLEEADGLTPDAQQSLRNIMERFHKNCKFILTCNYISKIIEPIQSRCCGFEFSKPAPEAVIKRLEFICGEEKVTYEHEAIVKIVADTFPDIRSAINTLERSVVNNEVSMKNLVLPSRELEEIYEEIKAKKFSDIRKRLASISFDYPEIYLYLFNQIAKSKMKKEARSDILIELADRAYRDSYVPNKEMNFLAGMVKLWRLSDAAAVTEW